MLGIVILNRMNHSSKSNNIIGSNNITINENIQRRSSPEGRSLRNTCFSLLLIIFILTSGMLSIMLIKRNNRINHLKDNLRIKQNFIVETQNQNNQAVKQLNNLLSEKNATIEQLNKTLIEIKQERSRISNHKK
jgi:hypothetical protein